MTSNLDQSSTLEIALNIRENVEEYLRTKDRQALVQALRDQFLAQRHNSATTTEQARELAARVLIGRIPQMSDSMLLRAISELAKVGEIDMQAILTGSVGGRGPLFAFSQTLNTGEPSPQNALSVSGPSDTPGENPVKHAGNVLEAIEHLQHYLKNKSLEGPNDPQVTDAEIIKEPE